MNLRPILVAAVLLTRLPAEASDPSTYGGDVGFLKKHTPVIELKDGDAAVALAPAFQGRVMTSTAGGADGSSFGWLNYNLVRQGILSKEAAAGRLESHIYVFGGEERLWVGPEGGQYGIFFPPGAKFDFAFWKTPPALDTEPFGVVSHSAKEAVFAKTFSVTNRAGTVFDLEARRAVRLLDRKEISARLGTGLPDGVKVVGYETTNTITNRGKEAWVPEKGLLSIWMLGMYKPSPATVMAIPFREGAEAKLGPVVNDAYFGKIPSARLKVDNGVVFFKGDGGQRGKIGIPPRRSLGVAGSYSPDMKALTIVLTSPAKGNARYVNSMWENQKAPYAGDAINAYNDGSPAPGQPPLGPFYELETSSPAAALRPGKSLTHRQTTIHLVGEKSALDPVAKAKLRTGISGIEGAFSTAGRPE